MRPGWGCGWVRGGIGAQRQLARCGGLGSCTFVVPVWHRLAPDLPGELRVIEVLLHHLHTAGEAVVGAASAAVEAVVVELAASPPGMAWRRPWRCFKCLSSASGPCVFQYCLCMRKAASVALSAFFAACSLRHSAMLSRLRLRSLMGRDH